MTEGDHTIEQRKEKILSLLKTKSQWLYFLGLAFVVWFGAIFIRTANIKGLKDVAGNLNGYALAPDLDPYLFLRWAKELVANGSLSPIDMMRYAPLGFDTTRELPGVHYGIAYLYKLLHLFSDKVTVEYAAIIFPVVAFSFTLVAFYFMVRKIFSGNKLSDAIALISTIVLAVIPGFVHRTVAGVPEKESIAFLFMFLSIYFIVSGWQEKNWKKAIVFGLLSGFMTGLMGLTWGGVPIMFVIVSISAFAHFFTKNYTEKDLGAYAGWVFGFSLLLMPQPRYGLELFTSTTGGLAYITLGILIMYSLTERLKIWEKFLPQSSKLTSKVSSVIALGLLGLIFLLIFSPGMIMHLYGDIKGQLITPFEGDRLTVTVAENSRPFFDTWYGSFGKIFWIFFLGSVFLIWDYLKSLKQENRILLTVTYLLLISGIVFTRLNSASKLDGSSPLSIILYMLGALVFIVSAIYAYYNDHNFEVETGIVILLVWTFFSFISARGAIRLLYFMYPIAAAVCGYVIVRVSQLAYQEEDRGKKIIWLIFALLIAWLMVSATYNYSVSAYNEVAYGSVPSSYNIQWQKAMGWVRTTTPQDSIFVHWWDYGYWVQTIGERATVLDGGNAISYWNHLMGRSLTAQNETEALQFYKTHEADYLLIDSTDIGKYTAFSSIGSDENYDRYSYFATFYYDAKSTQEKRNETQYVLSGGGVGFDEDIIYKDKVFSPGNGGIAGFILPIQRIGDSVAGSLNQPLAIVVNNGEQMQVPIKCVYLDGKITFENEGIDGCLYIVPQVTDSGVQKIGAGLWLSPRLMRSQLTKMYLLDEYENFELVHTENYPVIDDLNARYGLNLPSFSVVQGQLLGPIKIWKINYPADVTVMPEYLEKTYPKDRPGLWQVRA